MCPALGAKEEDLGGKKSVGKENLALGNRNGQSDQSQSQQAAFCDMCRFVFQREKLKPYRGDY